MASDCDNLDRLLLDDLASTDAAAFEAHLTTCAACREAVDQQRWIDGLLQLPARAELETPSADLIREIDISAARHRSQRRLAACGLAAAAMIVVAVTWAIQLNRQASHGTKTPVAAADSGPARATFIGGDDVIVVPVASRHPNVTVVRVYQTFRPDFADQATVGEQPDADDFFPPDEINGG